MKSIVYLGDSLTAGVMSDMVDDRTRMSYYNQINLFLINQKKLKSSYNFAVSGFTSSDLLKQIYTNISYNQNLSFNVQNTFNYQRGIDAGHDPSLILLQKDVYIKDAIRDADILVMSIGGNDYIYHNYLQDPTKILSSDALAAVGRKLRKNILELFILIRKLNLNCQVYFFLEYSPSRYKIFQKLLLNEVISNELLLKQYLEVLDDDKIYLLSLYERFEEKKNIYLNNPLDIHPSQAGHDFMAYTFFKSFLKNNSSFEIPFN